LISGRFPTYEKRESIPIPQELIKEILPQGDYHVQEERRLFYVGVTRAMDHLYLSASQKYGEGKRERKVSPFVIETIGEEKVKNARLLTIFDFKKVEMPVITKPLELKNFSYSQLESFNTCALQYKYQHILKIPTQPTAAASYGDSIHRTLQKFYELYMQDPSIGLDTLLRLFDETWLPVGYTSAAHHKRMKEEGHSMLTHFFEKFHHPHLHIIGLEKIFKIKIDDEIYITGKIDRVDKNGDEIEIIDYKTGKQPNEKEIKKSLQLSLYALAASHERVFNFPLEKITLTFYYLQTMQKISMKRTQEELSDVSMKVKETVEQIKKNQFLPHVGPWCDFCPFRMICEAWQ
jgi:DNA helicase-2/ATP-dependent DNA helicase PcrA